MLLHTGNTSKIVENTMLLALFMDHASPASLECSATQTSFWQHVTAPPTAAALQKSRLRSLTMPAGLLPFFPCATSHLHSSRGPCFISSRVFPSSFLTDLLPYCIELHVYMKSLSSSQPVTRYQIPSSLHCALTESYMKRHHPSSSQRLLSHAPCTHLCG